MRRTYIAVLGLTILLAGCKMENSGGEYVSLQGFTQGTTYRITYQHPSEDYLQEQIDSLLKVFDSSLSTYDSSSIITAINRNLPGVRTDSMFRTVFRESARIYQITGGAFDITLGPVIDAWGFGPGEKLEVDSAMIDSLLQYVGMEKVFLEGDRIVKSHPSIVLNVNAIAQGYAVDVVSTYLESLECRNFMVEIGGEIRTKGVNKQGNFWRIGVDRPDFGNMIPGKQLQVIINMHNRSLATSGNYRKFYEKDGIMITHSINPATGFPKESKLLSATVLTEDCMTADAYATACMVMGLDKAKTFIQNLKGVDAYLIFGDEFGAFQVWYTDGLRKYLD